MTTDEPEAQTEPLNTDPPNKRPPRKRGLRQAELVERQAQVLEMRKLGITYRDIGLRLGINVKTAWDDNAAALRSIIAAPAADVRAMEIERLDYLWRNAIAIVASPDSSPEVRLKAVDTALRIASRRAAMEGLDAPQKYDIGPWLEELARSQGLDADVAYQTAREIVRSKGF